MEAQELQRIQQIAMSVVDDLDDASCVNAELEPEAAAVPATGGALGLPPKRASPRPQLISGDGVSNFDREAR